ncbi:hypothetical protein BGZ70_008987, partial [Mortierella alpina]
NEIDFELKTHFQANLRANLAAIINKRCPKHDAACIKLQSKNIVKDAVKFTAKATAKVSKQVDAKLEARIRAAIDLEVRKFSVDLWLIKINVTGDLDISHDVSLRFKGAAGISAKACADISVKEASTKPKSLGNKPTPLLLPIISTKHYTQVQLREQTRLRLQRYDDLLKCARSGDMRTHMMIPDADGFEVPMAKVCLPLSVKIELLDIYHYLKARQGHLSRKVSQSSFGFLIGCHVPKSTLSTMLRCEAKLRAASKALPKDETAEKAEKASPAGLDEESVDDDEDEEDD